MATKRKVHSAAFKAQVALAGCDVCIPETTSPPGRMGGGLRERPSIIGGDRSGRVIEPAAKAAGPSMGRTTTALIARRRGRGGSESDATPRLRS